MMLVATYAYEAVIFGEITPEVRDAAADDQSMFLVHYLIPPLPLTITND
jgi:hypothetical protein